MLHPKPSTVSKGGRSGQKPVQAPRPLSPPTHPKHTKHSWTQLAPPPTHLSLRLTQGAGPVGEEDVKLVLSADGTPLGEAFVHFKHPRSKVRLALAKDHSVMPVSARLLAGVGAVAWCGWVSVGRSGAPRVGRGL